MIDRRVAWYSARDGKADVRVLTSHDIERVVSIYIETFNAPPWKDGWSREAAHERLRRLVDYPGSLGVVAEIDGAPVAYPLSGSG
jgi:hypothetical protein